MEKSSDCQCYLGSHTGVIYSSALYPTLALIANIHIDFDSENK